MNLEQLIKTECADGIWTAHLTHPILGFIDGRGLSEQMALANWRERLKVVAQAESTARYARLRAKHPAYFLEKKTA